MSHDIEQHTPAPSPTRRTVLTGAAWSVPVIAAASLAPLATASGTPVLTFNQSTYTGAACSTITDAYVSVTVNGVATAGTGVTTTLSGGYTFAGGATSYAGVSDTSGKVTLPAINVPASGGTSSVTAATGSTNSSATVQGAANSTAKTWYTSASSAGSYSNVPVGSTPVGWLTFLAPNGDLYYNNTRIDTNVTSAVTDHTEPGSGYQRDFISLVSNGTAKTYYSSQSGAPNAWNGIPTGSKAIGWVTWLAPNGDLYYGGNVLAQNVTSATADHRENGTGYSRDFLSFVSNGKAYVWYSGSAGIEAKANVPTGSKAVGWLTFLAPNGDLYYNNTLLDTNVTSARNDHTEPGSGYQRDFISLVSNGTAKAYYSSQSGGPTAWSGIPTGSTAIGWATWLAPNGNLYYNGGLLAKNVAYATAQHNENGTGFSRDFLTYTPYSAC
jgi:hypothetical protein